MKTTRFLFILLALHIPAALLYSQGCSDAGFCSMGAMRPDQVYDKNVAIKLHSVELNQYWGKTTLSPKISVTTLDLILGISRKNFFQIKLPYQKTTGNLTDAFENKPITAIGDISLSFTRNLKSTDTYDVYATVGTKIPVNNADLEDERGNELHMYYQTSLGTYDLVLGTSYISQKWLFATGLQVPVIHKNENTFRWGEWSDYESQDYIRSHENHPPGTEFRRGMDMMVRVERNFRFYNYSFNIGLLPIYRITPDKYYDPATDKINIKEGTTGLAMSALAGATYHFNVNTNIRFLYGKKLTQRDFNPDGLTREQVMSIALVYKF